MGIIGNIFGRLRKKPNSVLNSAREKAVQNSYLIKRQLAYSKRGKLKITKLGSDYAEDLAIKRKYKKR